METGDGEDPSDIVNFQLPRCTGLKEENTAASFPSMEVIHGLQVRISVSAETRGSMGILAGPV